MADPNAKLSRHEQLERAAKIKAIVIAHLNSVNAWVTFGSISSALSDRLKEFNYSDDSLRALLNQLAQNRLIMRETEGNKKPRYASINAKYSLGVTSQEPTPPQVAKVTKPEAIKPDQQSLVVDLVKSTGRVRVAWQGLVIEIGIVD